jgi:N-acetyltransferase
MGAGKSTILGEASDLLALRQIPHAAIDLDALGLAFLGKTSANDNVMYANFQSVAANYAALGVQRFLLARAMESRAELDLCRESIKAANTVVCRLTASVETMRQRVNTRELGVSKQEFIARASRLNNILDTARLEDFTVANENRSLAEVALEMLTRAEWISI